MTPDGSIKLVSELLDLPLYDIKGRHCGVVDDVELTGGPGKPLKLKALMIGPGAYAGRLPAWASWAVSKLVGRHVTRVPVDRIRTISSGVHLSCEAGDLGLDKSEKRAAALIPRRGAY